MSNLDSLIESALLREDEALLRIADTAEDHVFSPGFEEALDAKFHTKITKATPTLKRVIAYVAVAAMLVGSAFAFWGNIIELFVRVFPKYEEIRAGSKDTPNKVFYSFPDSWSNVWIPEYITTGYTFLNATEDLNAKQLHFISDTGNELLFEQCPEELTAFGDYEGNLVPDIFVLGHTAYAFEKSIDNNKFRRIAWTNGQSYFLLSGFISFNELVSIGESISLREIGES